MQTWAKYVRLAVVLQARQHEPKWPKTNLIYDVPQKNPEPKTKKFFSSLIRRLAKSFKGSKSSDAFGQRITPLLRHVKTTWFQADFKVRYIRTPAVNVLKYTIQSFTNAVGLILILVCKDESKAFNVWHSQRQCHNFWPSEALKLEKLLYMFVSQPFCSIKFLLMSLSHVLSQHSATCTKNFLICAHPAMSSTCTHTDTKTHRFPRLPHIHNFVHSFCNHHTNAGTCNPRGLTHPAQDSSKLTQEELFVNLLAHLILSLVLFRS